MEGSWYYYNLSVSENGFSLGTDPPTKPQPSFFSISPSTEKFNRPRSRFEIEPSKPYFILQSLPRPPPTPDKYMWHKLLQSPPRHSFLFYPPFQNLVLKVALLSIKRRADAVKCCICKFSFSLSFFTSIFNFIFIFHFP